MSHRPKSLKCDSSVLGEALTSIVNFPHGVELSTKTMLVMRNAFLKDEGALYGYEDLPCRVKLDADLDDVHAIIAAIVHVTINVPVGEVKIDPIVAREHGKMHTYFIVTAMLARSSTALPLRSTKAPFLLAMPSGSSATNTA